jgi:intracellular septation protein A
MNLRTLLRALLPGLAPILVYVAADAIFGEVVGLVVGLATGVAEFIYTLVRQRRADPFVAADTALLAVAGGLSLLLKNDMFFKLKPAVIEGVLAASLGVLLLMPPAVLKGWLGSQLRGITFPDSTLPFMKRSLALMTLALVAHAGLTVWAALALSTAAWGFISGGLLYILFGAVALGQFIAARVSAHRRRSAAGPGSPLPVIDETGKVLRVAAAAECHQGPGTLHPRVHLLVTDGLGTGALYLRPAASPAGGTSGAMTWEQSMSFHVHADRTLESALALEMGRQLGIAFLPGGAKEDGPRLAAKYRRDDQSESEMIFFFLLVHGSPRAAGGRFWTAEEIRQARGKGIFVDTLERDLDILSMLARSPA